jgi:hypothetical protein
MFQTNDVADIKIHFEILVTFFFENHAVVEIKCKNTVEPDRLQMTMWRMLDAKGYNHTLRICNINCFSSATMVTRTRFKVTLHIDCIVTLSLVLVEVIEQT